MLTVTSLFSWQVIALLISPLKVDKFMNVGACGVSWRGRARLYRNPVFSAREAGMNLRFTRNRGHQFHSMVIEGINPSGAQ